MINRILKLSIHIQKIIIFQFKTYKNCEDYISLFPELKSGFNKKSWDLDTSKTHELYISQIRDHFTIKSVEEYCGEETITYKLNKKLHREIDKPSVIFKDGTKMWYLHGEIHRQSEEQPAYESESIKAWYNRGKYIKCNEIN